MPDLFESPRQLISHARDLIASADDMIADYIGKREWTKVVYDDPVTLEKIHCARMAGPDLPPKVANIVKDAAGNLRDVLDHAAYSAAVAIVGGEPLKTGFPFAKNAAGVSGELNGPRLSGNPPAIHSVLANLKPYEGGNDTLWALNQLRNPSIHRFIVPVGSAAVTGPITIERGVISGGRIGYSTWDPVKSEVEYARVGAGSSFSHQVRFSVNITFEKVAVVTGKPVIPMLKLMASEAELCVAAIEAECKRLGFI